MLILQDWSKNGFLREDSKGTQEVEGKDGDHCRFQVETFIFQESAFEFECFGVVEILPLAELEGL